MSPTPQPQPPKKYFQDEPKPTEDALLPSAYSRDPSPLTYAEPERRHYFADYSDEAPYAAAELSVEPGESFADTEFKVRVRAAVPTDVEYRGDDELPPSISFIVRQGKREWNLVRRIENSASRKIPAHQPPPLPAGYQAEWSVLGSSLQQVGADGGVPKFEAGPVEIRAVFLAPDPNSSRFSRGSRMLTYVSASVAVNL